MIIEQKDVDKIFEICNFFDEFKFKYNDDSIFDLSQSIEMGIDRLLVLFEEINKKKESK